MAPPSPPAPSPTWMWEKGSRQCVVMATEHHLTLILIVVPELSIGWGGRPPGPPSPPQPVDNSAPENNLSVGKVKNGVDFAGKGARARHEFLNPVA